MRFNLPVRQKQLSLLLAVLLLLSNALVTAHAFGDADHATADDCQLLHQFERELHAPLASLPPPADAPRHVLPQHRLPIAVAATAPRHFQSRAPPSV